MVVHELSICIRSKQTVMLFVFVSVIFNFKLPKAGVNFVQADNRGIIYMHVHVRLARSTGS